MSYLTVALCQIVLYAYKRLLVGLKYTGNTFQCFKDEILRGLPLVFVYIDDILIISHDHDDHCHDLSKVFALCHHYGVTLNKEKGVFGMTEIEFLCHVINEDLMSSLKRKITAVC